MQLITPSASVSAAESTTPHPQVPGVVFNGSNWQPSSVSGVPSLSSSRSLQSAAPSESESTSGTPSSLQSSGLRSNIETVPVACKAPTDAPTAPTATTSPSMARCPPKRSPVAPLGETMIPEYDHSEVIPRVKILTDPASAWSATSSRAAPIAIRLPDTPILLPNPSLATMPVAKS